jgi:DNA-binding GntR family transcriptional regulator
MSTERPLEASLAEYVYKQLRADLLSGRLLPGAKLKISDVGETLSVNLSAVREALSRLSADGLVVAQPQRGFRVAPVSAPELRDLTRARIEIDALCMRLSVANPDIAWETGLVAAKHRLIRTAKAEDGAAEPLAAWAAAHSDFHRALIAGCDSPWLMRIHNQLFTQAERYQRLSVRAPGGRPDIDLEHAALADAMLARDGDLAAQLIDGHYQRTADLVIASGLAEEA